MILKTSHLKEQESENARKFVSSFQDSRNQLFRLTNGGVRNIVRLMGDFRIEALEAIRSSLANEPGGEFRVESLAGIQASLNNSLDVLKLNSSKEINSFLQNGFDLGQNVTANALRAVDLPVAFPSVSPAVLATISRDAIIVMDELFSDLGTNILSEINKAAVGLTPSSTAIRRVSKLIQTSPEVVDGLRKRIKATFQAEEIVRTEIGRVFSVAQQTSSEQLTEIIPDLRKSWLTVGDTRTRIGHRNAERKYAIGGDVGPIPIKSKFTVVDHSRTGITKFLTLGGKVQPGGGKRVAKVGTYTRRGGLVTDKMLHPRDPGASAGNVIQCRCVVIDVIPEIEESIDKVKGIISQG